MVPLFLKLITDHSRFLGLSTFCSCARDLTRSLHRVLLHSLPKLFAGVYLSKWLTKENRHSDLYTSEEDGGGGLSSCTQPKTGCQTKNQTHTQKTYCGVLQNRKVLHLYILVRVGVGVELWAWTTLQPTILTRLQTETACSNG